MNPAVVVLAAPSGSGKTTIARALVEGRPDRYGFSVSATTRPPRPTEREGQDYFFLSRAEFLRRRQAGEFLEWAEYAGELYGTLQREVDRLLASGRHALLDIEVQGARQVRARFPAPRSRLVFIVPPSADELLRRLEGRRTESPAQRARRIHAAIAELGAAAVFDHVVVNADVAGAVAAVDRVIEDPARGVAPAAAAGQIRTLVAQLTAKGKELA